MDYYKYHGANKYTAKGSGIGSNGSTVLRLLLAFVIVASGVGVSVVLLKTSPKAEPRPKPVFETVVRVETVNFSSHPTTIKAMGTVMAEKELELKPRVSGEIVSLSEDMVVGGYFPVGEALFTLDDADYKLALLEAQSEVAIKKGELDLEKGSQRVAATEFALLGEAATDEETELMLRKPQLESKQASLAASRARLARANLNLKRTNVLSPFNGVVKERFVNVGARVSETSPLAHLVGTDVFLVELVLPVEQLQWINFPVNDQRGSAVRIYPQNSSDGSFRVGEVVRQAVDLEPQGRMGRIFVEVEDPLGLQSVDLKRLFLGSFVWGEIEGKEIEAGYLLNRSYLRDNNTVWLVAEDGNLEVRHVEAVFKNENSVIIADGLVEGEKLVVSSISSPVAGMKIRIEGSGKNSAKTTKKKKLNEGAGER